MVFFICNHCGESAKKPAVEKHYNTRCRGAVINVSCMDCLKDFRGEEFKAHTKCVTELQKYSGKNYVHKESSNSGAKKQEGWMEIVRSILETMEYHLSDRARRAFEAIQTVDNVPRKKAKFHNFTTKCMRFDKRTADEVWNVLERELEKMKQAKQSENNAQQEAKQQNGLKREATEESELDGPKKKKAKKVKSTEDVELKEQTHVTTEQNGHAKLEKKSKKKKSAVDGTQQNGEDAYVADHVVPDEPKKKKKKSMQQQTSVDEGALQLNGKIDEVESKEATKKKSKKQVPTEETAETDTPTMVLDQSNVVDGDDDQFQWAIALEKVIKKNADGIQLEKLKQKVLKKYTAKLALETLTEKQQKKFEKKFSKQLKKCASVILEGEFVKSAIFS